MTAERQSETPQLNPPTGPLTGVRVVEFGQLMACPMAGAFMADLGAEVIHVEPPGKGDSQRYVGPQKNDVPLWWKVSGRNKRSVTLDLHKATAQDIAHQLVVRADVVIVNMRSSALRSF